MRNKEKGQFIFTVVFTLAALILMVTYNFMSFYSKAVLDMEAIGMSSLRSETEQLEKYLAQGMDTVRATKYTVNYMMQHGATVEEIEDYFKEESANYQRDIDPNFSGIYGLIQDHYLDGVGWVPNADYDPTKRAWYREAVKADGAPVLVSPYVDSRTHEVITSVCTLLDDGESVLSLDVVLNQVQEITENIDLNGMGYGFVVDNHGLVIAHHNREERGKIYWEEPQMSRLLQRVYDSSAGFFRLDIRGEACTVFTDTIMDNWRVIMIVSNTKLFHDIRDILFRNIFVTCVIFFLIVLFCALALLRVNQSMKLEFETRRKLEQLYGNIVRALAHTIDAKDRYTSGHSQRVAHYSVEIAKRMGKSEEEQRDIYYAGLLHDVGKIRVPEDVINKPGRLTNEEFEQIKVHPLTGFYILKDIYEDKEIAFGAKFHHERYDGKGYPNGLIGESIPEIARIIGVADAYDAMASNRSYRKALPQEVVRSEIEKGSGQQFDPVFAGIMLEMIDEDTEYNMKELDSMQKMLLVVDDKPANIQMVETIMEDEPMSCVTGAHSGAEALEILENTHIDLILLDVKMPDMDGFETLSRVRARFQTPIVFMVDGKDVEILRKFAEMRIDDYITKPVTSLALKEVIHSMVGDQL